MIFKIFLIIFILLGLLCTFFRYYQNKQENNQENTFLKSLSSHTTDTCKVSNVEDKITYISGTNDCINFNYVWYSGKLWRITAINSDGTLKMITNDNITTIAFDDSYKDSYFYKNADDKLLIYQWLNIVMNIIKVIKILIPKILILKDI